MSEGASMALYSEKERTARSRPVRLPGPGPALHEVVVLVTLAAKRERVLEVKMHRIAAELRIVTGFPAIKVQTGGSGSAVFASRSWIGPDVVVSMLRARLEQETPNGAIFAFEPGVPSDTVIALEASRVARM